MLYTFFFFVGKMPDAVNFWLGEEHAVTSSRFYLYNFH